MNAIPCPSWHKINPRQVVMPLKSTNQSFIFFVSLYKAENFLASNQRYDLFFYMTFSWSPENQDNCVMFVFIV